MYKIKNIHYYNRYMKFIHYYKSHKFPNEVYAEKHHIIPKSMNGSDSVKNIVRLSARTHYLAHYMLWKSYRNDKTAFAFIMMNTKNKKCKFSLNSKLYSKTLIEARKRCGGIISKKLKGKLIKEKNPMYGKIYTNNNRKIMSIVSNTFWNSNDGTRLRKKKSCEMVGKSNIHALRGYQHPNFNSFVYTFKNIKSNEIFLGNMFDFRKKYNLCGDIYYLLDGKRKKYKQYKGWTLTNEN